MAVFLVLLPETLARATDLADIVERVTPAVVGVGTVRPVKLPGIEGPPLQFRGTGFVIGDGRHVVTNFHVIPKDLDTRNRETLAIFVGRGDQSQVRPVQVLAQDKVHDLAVLYFEGEPLPVLKLDEKAIVRAGTAIAFTGFPIGVVLGLFPATHRGIISAITPLVIAAASSKSLSALQIKRMKQRFDVYQLDATAYPGNSGSPVFDAQSGKVIGVLNSVFVKQTKEELLGSPSGISYAIPIVHLKKMLGEGGS